MFKYDKILYDSTKWDSNYKKINKWAVTEKVHGSNFSFIYDIKSDSFKYAKRNAILEEDDDFFGYKNILDETIPKIKIIIDFLKKNFKTFQALRFLGSYLVIIGKIMKINLFKKVFIILRIYIFMLLIF
uniref:Uncharacterized protein n=1 Tax=viral metagenome TaxID=1070528 RepID=A0A6C0AEP7_9ZZZZ